MKKDLIIIDVQSHFLEYTDKTEYIEKLSKYIIQNKQQIGKINLVFDLHHESEELPQEDLYYIYEELDNINIEYNDLEKEKLQKLIIEYRMPIELSKILLKLEEENNIELNIIEKYYGGIRNIIDFNIVNTKSYVDLIFELNKSNIDSENITYRELEDISKKNKKILKSIKILENNGQTIYDIVENLNDARLNIEEEINKYKNVVSTKNTIEVMGGGITECMAEEIASIMKVSEENGNTTKIIPKIKLSYGGIGLFKEYFNTWTKNNKAKKYKARLIT